VIVAYKNPSFKSAELLAKYCNVILKPSSRDRKDEDMDQTLNTIVLIFGLLREQDVFIKFYSVLLAKRLIYGVFDDDHEMMVIAKLKVRFYFQWSNLI
jgi:cullin 1